MQTPSAESDVIVMGAGPAGCAAAILLAREGLRVTMLDAARHPRHHIGESLLPASMPILARLGISADDLHARYQPKFGARFYDPAGDRLGVFDFEPSPGFTTPAFQVVREDFDTLLCRRARESGVDVREDSTIVAVDENQPCVTLRDGVELRARFLVDATGRAALLATRRKTRTSMTDYGRIGIYNYFTHLPPHDDADARYITMYVFGDDVGCAGWVWLIPLRDGRTSVGVVHHDPPATPGGAEKPEALFWNAVERMPRLRRRLRAVRATEPFRAIANYSYAVSEHHGTRFALIGDAAGFLDPIFSSGVHLALWSAQRAVPGIIARIKTNSGKLGSDGAELDAYSTELARGFAVFRAFVHRFYNRDLVSNLFFMNDKPPRIHAAITRILAGHVWDDDNPVLKLLGLERKSDPRP